MSQPDLAAEESFLRSIDASKPPAIILGSRSPTTLALVRSLGRRGVPVAAVTHQPGGRLLSRYCRINRMFDETGLLEFLKRIGARLPCKGVILAAGDAEVLFLSRNREELSRSYEFMLPDEATFERFANKRTQYEYAASIGVPTPRTCAPANHAEMLRFAGMVGYPCVIKPVYSHLWRRHSGVKRWPKAAQVETPTELTATFDEMSASGVQMLVQERIEGPSSRSRGVYLYLNRDSQPLVAIVTHKHRQSPPLYGSGTYIATCREDEPLNASLKLLQSCGYRGVVSVEMKQDTKDGRFKLIEVNVRAAIATAVLGSAGADLPFIAYLDILGRPVAPVTDYELGVTWINLVEDFASLAHYRETEQLSLWSWLRSALLAKSHAYLALDDPLPFLLEMARAAKRMPAYVYGRSLGNVRKRR